MRRRYKRNIAIVWTLALPLACAPSLQAWGNRGHRIVGLIAESHLTPEASSAVSSLLGGQALADVATWADAIRPDRPETARWHYVDIPVGANEFSPERDCALEPKGDCILAAIGRSIEVLGDSTQPTSARGEAVRFLVHFVGDLHQPLHCAEREGDGGGGAVKVTYFGEKRNLHQVWDTAIIESAGLGTTAFVKELMELIPEEAAAEWLKGSIEDWALESHDLARSQAYQLPSSKRLGTAYYRENAWVVDEQLSKAGLRLARVLNEALANQ